jgi:hypothetical protein
MNKDNKNTELDNTDKKSHIYDVIYRFSTVEEAIKELKLDKRTDWFEFQGKIVKKVKGDRHGHKFPEPLIINGNYVYVEK